MRCNHENYLGECAWNFSWSGEWIKCRDIVNCPAGNSKDNKEWFMEQPKESKMIEQIMTSIKAGNIYGLSQWEIDFMNSIRGELIKILSPRQLQKLWDIYLKLPHGNIIS